MRRLAYILIALLACSCTKTLYVPTETRYVNTENTRVLRDTVRENHFYHTNDCTVMATRGDTVRVEHFKTVLDRTMLEHLQSSLDSLKKARVDSIPYPVTVTKVEKVRELYWWQKALCWAGGAVLLLCLVLAGAKLIPIIKKFI